MKPVPINGMTLNKELRDKQMTGVGQEGEPMFAVRSNGAQHAVAHAFYSTGGSHGLESQEEISPPIKVGSALGIPSPPAVVTGCLTPELPQRVRIHGTGGTSPTLSSEHGRGHGVPSVLAPCAVDCYNQTISDVAIPIRSKASDIDHTGGVLVPTDAVQVQWASGGAVWKTQQRKH